jgi:hypothetical protein
VHGTRYSAEVHGSSRATDVSSLIIDNIAYECSIAIVHFAVEIHVGRAIKHGEKSFPGCRSFENIRKDINGKLMMRVFLSFTFQVEGFICVFNERFLS